MSTASTACSFTIDLTEQCFIAFSAPESIFGVNEQRILTDLADFRRLPTEKYFRAVGMYFSRPDEADRTYRAFAELAVGRPCQYTAHMRNAATRQFTLCEVAAAPSPDGKTACGTVTPKQ